MSALLQFLFFVMSFLPVITGYGHYRHEAHYLDIKDEAESSISFLLSFLDSGNFALLAIFTLLTFSRSLRAFLFAVASVLANGISDAGKPVANNAVITALERRAAECQKSIDNLTSQLRSKDAELEKERKATENAYKQIEAMEITLTIQEEEIDKLTANSNENLQHQISDLRHLLKEHDLDILDHLNAVDEANELVDNIRRAKQAEVSSLNSRLTAREKEVSNLTATIKDLESEARAHHDEKSSLTFSRNKFVALVDIIHHMVEQTADPFRRELAVMFLLVVSQLDYNVADLCVDPRKLENIEQWLRLGTASCLRDPGNVRLEGHQYPLSRIVVSSAGISSGLSAPMMDKQLAQAQLLAIMGQQQVQQQPQAVFDWKQYQQQQQQQQQQPAAVPAASISLATAPPLSSSAAPIPSASNPHQQPMKMGKYIITPADKPAPAALDKSLFGLFGAGKKTEEEEEYEEDEDGRPVKGGNGKKRRA